MRAAGMGTLAPRPSLFTSHLPGSGFSMLCARPEAVVLLGALLTASLDPAGKYPAPLASGCHPVPPEDREEQMQASYKIRQITRSGMGNIPGQLQSRSGVASWVRLGALCEREKHGRGRRVPGWSWSQGG